MRPTTLNLLIAARGMLERGQTAFDGTGPGAMSAVVLFDLAVETAAKAILWDNEPSAYPGRGYVTKAGELEKPLARDPSLPRVLDGLLAAQRLRTGDETTELAHRRDALRLHDFRNSVQHDGVIPSPDEVARSRFRASDAVEEICRIFSGIGLLALSRARLVLHSDVRDALTRADEHIASGQHAEALKQAALAFAVARRELRASRPFRGHPANRFTVSSVVRELGAAAPASTPRSRDPFAEQRRFAELKGLLENLVSRQEVVEDFVDALLVGATPEQYAWFRECAPRVDWTRDESGDGYVPLVQEPSADVSAADARRAFEFVLDAVLRWQAAPTWP